MWILRNSFLMRNSPAIFERFLPWKRVSWATANRSFYMMVLLISKHFAVWKSDYYEVANQPLQDGITHIWTIRSLKTRILCISKSTPLLDGTAHFQHFAAKIRDCWASAIQPHWEYVKISQFENAIPEHQLIDRLDGTTHIWTFPTLKTKFLCISKSKSFLDGTAHIGKFPSLKLRMLCICNLTVLEDDTAHFF